MTNRKATMQKAESRECLKYKVLTVKMIWCNKVYMTYDIYITAFSGPSVESPTGNME